MEKEQYQKIISKWSESCKDENINLTFCDYIIYAILRGKNPNKCISPGTRDNTWRLLSVDWSWYKRYPQQFLSIIDDAISEDEFISLLEKNEGEVFA